MNLDELLGLPRAGVIVLEKQGKVLVTYTTSMGAYLETLYQEFGGKTGVELRVLSAGADLETLKLHTEYYREYYRKLGMLLQAAGRRAIQYKVRIVPSADLKFIDVEIVSARGDSKFVGRFKTRKESEEFIETYYRTGNPFCLPVYAANSDTKLFLQGEYKKKLEFR